MSRTRMQRRTRCIVILAWILLILSAVSVTVVLIASAAEKSSAEKSVVIYHEDGRAMPEVDHPTPAEAPTVHTIKGCAITGYCACCTPYSSLNTDEQGRVLVSSGKWVEPGNIVAVDPDVIPLGASVIIDNVEYHAEDTGVTGNVVDILMSHDEAAVAGVQYKTVLWYVEGE